MMKNSTLAAITLMIFTLLGCQDSTSEEFENINGNVKEKLIKSITVNKSNPGDFLTHNFYYDNNNRLIKIQEDDFERDFNFTDNNDLESISNSNYDDILLISDLTQSPYSAFEIIENIEYDNNGNPSVVNGILGHRGYFYFHSDNYPAYAGDVKVEITYDDSHNPYFYTLESAGIIGVLDKIDISLNINSQPSEIIKLRALFPNQNPSKFIYTNNEGDIIEVVNITYQYDNDNYPISANINIKIFNPNNSNENIEKNSSFEYVYLE